MENVAELPQKALSSELSDKPEPPEPPELPENIAPETPREHIRAPELHRHGTKLLMALTAAAGAAAGARLAFWDGSGLSESAMSGISQMLAGTFGAVFLRQTLLGAAFLAVEFVLGFFALGDLLVWSVPFLCAMGGVLQIASGSPLVIVSAIIRIVAVAAGAVYSADMSGLLMRLSRGGTVHMGTRPRRTYALGFLGCFAAAVLSAILAGI